MFEPTDENKLAHVLRTNFDFKEANLAIQKALNKLKESDSSQQASTHDDDSNFDEWTDKPSTAARSSNTRQS